MNQVAKIEKSLGRVFCPPHVPSSDAPREIVPPTDTDWHPLPERLFDGITFTARFIGNANHIPERGYVERVHCADGKAFATDGQSLVEYDMGASPSFSLQPAKIALLKSFGEAPMGNDVLGDKYKPFEEFGQFDSDDAPSTSDVTMIISQYMEEAERFRSDNVVSGFGGWYYVVNGEESQIRSGPPTKIGRK